jgi:hypothetical protein
VLALSDHFSYSLNKKNHIDPHLPEKYLENCPMQKNNNNIRKIKKHDTFKAS